ncbi:MAG: hypothetical protein KAH32_08000 [Chlamydiia bacterium]|nr:hypothetical protein [Chlamydiia bacterium]
MRKINNQIEYRMKKVTMIAAMAFTMNTYAQEISLGVSTGNANEIHGMIKITDVYVGVGVIANTTNGFKSDVYKSRINNEGDNMSFSAFSTGYSIFAMHQVTKFISIGGEIGVQNIETTNMTATETGVDIKKESTKRKSFAGVRFTANISEHLYVTGLFNSISKATLGIGVRFNLRGRSKSN